MEAIGQVILVVHVVERPIVAALFASGLRWAVCIDKVTVAVSSTDVDGDVTVRLFMPADDIAR